MNIVPAIFGALLGGSIWHFGGVVMGAIVGWLCGRVHELGERQDDLQRDLRRLRERKEGFRETVRQQPTPDAAVPCTATEPAPLQLTEQDLVLDDVEPPVCSVPGSVRPGKDTTRHRPVSVEPEQPSPFVEWLQRFFSGENLLVKLGVAILFLGISFLVKYAAQHGLFPVELRLAAAALVGCALAGTGWRLRDVRPLYAQVLQGGGVAIVYLTTYAAMRLYHVIPVSVGFAVLTAVCILAGLLAVFQNSCSLAVIGSAGGFLTPELASLGSGNHLILFGYYALLNLGILGVARYRTWRELDLVGFVGTFIVGSLWGCRFYRPELFNSVELFLILFFMIYALLPMLHARNERTELDNMLDVGLIFGTPFVTFIFQQQLVHRFEYGLAWSSLALGVFYLALAGLFLESEIERMRKLAEAFLSLGVLFATLTVPLALDGRWTSAVWSIEGAALIWAGLRQQRLLARSAGYLLIFGSGIAFVTGIGLQSGPWPILNSFFIGCLLEAAAGLFSAWLLFRSDYRLSEPERHLEAVLFGWGLVWWYAGGLQEIAVHTLSSQLLGVRLLFFSISCGALAVVQRRLQWQLLAVPAIGLLPVLGIFALYHLLEHTGYPSLHGGWYGWPSALAIWYLIVYRSEQDGNLLHPIVHAAPLWIVTMLGALEVSGRMLRFLPGMETWAACALGAAPALALLLISRYGDRVEWPVARHHASYLGWGCLPLAAVSWFWIPCVHLTQAGDPAPLPYLPLLNPLDVVTMLVLTSLTVWYRVLIQSLHPLAGNLPQRELAIAGSATLFFWLNAVLLRTIHHWFNVPFTAHALFSSLLVQATLSICWSLTALVLMIVATHRQYRAIWLAGAGLLGAVVLKLFLVDLAGHGSVSRIVSFVVVGLLILLIGWFAPAPPRRAAGGAS